MKILLFNKAYATRVCLGKNPCELCMYRDTSCRHIPTKICILYGGFQSSDTKIFTL